MTRTNRESPGHLELRFLREADIRALAGQIYREHPRRQRAASVDEVLDYARDRFDAGDEEWIRACEAKPKWKRRLGR